MHCQFLTVVLAASVVVQAGGPAKQPKKALAGWASVFPIMKGYELALQPAVVEGDKKSQGYRQIADYEWTGGADRHVTVTLARDAAFKKIYSEAEVKKIGPAAEKTAVGKYQAWLWKFEPKDKKEARPIYARLVILLAEDRVLVIEQIGRGPFAGTPQNEAAKFDLAKIKEALDNPPDTGSHRTVAAFRQLKKGMPYAEVSTWVGAAENDIGSGIHIMTYTLDDGSRVMLGFPDFNKLIYVKHQGRDGKIVDLVD